MGEAIVEDGGWMELENEGDRHPPNVRSLQLFSRG